MTHLSENGKRLCIKKLPITDPRELDRQLPAFDDVCLLILPSGVFETKALPANFLQDIADKAGQNATLITIGETADLLHAHAELSPFMQYQMWIGIKRDRPKVSENNSALPNCHFGALIHTKYKSSLNHTKTRIKYSYCPACDKTTKDYGGKKHTYNAYETLLSDIWRDISADPEGELSEVAERFADLFGVENYTELLVFDCRKINSEQTQDSGKITKDIWEYGLQPSLFNSSSSKDRNDSRLILGDVLETLADIPDNSVDFAFADPPYNLKKKYHSYADDLSVTEYFEWCDNWIDELARIIRPGRTCAILNIPLWAIRHFLHMEKILRFQNWIVWEALSFPVRNIMPAHYAIICFSKGQSLPLPGLVGKSCSKRLKNISAPCAAGRVLLPARLMREKTADAEDK